ncbi:MAG: DUF4174 domain-containing protein [Methylobacterium frigidaeris]
MGPGRASVNATLVIAAPAHTYGEGPAPPVPEAPTMNIGPVILAAVPLLVALPAGAASLDAYRWKARVLLVAAASADDPRLVEQRRIVAAAQRGTRERDLVVVEAVGAGAEAESLRRRFGLTGNDFRAVLVGKDGGAKLSAGEPIAAERLFATIDAMPMRREEAAERR